MILNGVMVWKSKYRFLVFEKKETLDTLEQN